MEQRLQFFIREGKCWVQEQREANRELARSLNAEELRILSSYFAPTTLGIAAIYSVQVIENPSFYADLQKMGQPIPLDFRQMHGITFIDTIAIAITKVNPSSDKWIPLLFHECVHICQYQQLGLDSFIERYIMGWACNGEDYNFIPLEVNAYDLQRKFESSSEPFSVEAMVQRQL